MAEARKSAKELLLEQIARMPKEQRDYLADRVRNDDRLSDETLRRLAKDTKILMDAADLVEGYDRLLTEKSSPIEDCARAKRLFNTAVGCGNDLVPESVDWLEKHLDVCRDCLDKYGDLWLQHVDG